MTEVKVDHSDEPNPRRWVANIPVAAMRRITVYADTRAEACALVDEIVENDDEIDPILGWGWSVEQTAKDYRARKGQA